MRVFLTLAAVWFLGLPGAVAQSMYGDKAKADVKVKYVYSLEEALKASAKENKPVFFTCFCRLGNALSFDEQGGVFRQGVCQMAERPPFCVSVYGYGGQQ